MAETRSTLDIEGATDTPKPRRTRLLLIGIDAYQHWGALSYPVSDCEGFFKVLKDHYGFSERDLIHENKRPLYDAEATTDMIYDELYRLSDKDESGKPHLSADDNLIVYYAGHGHLDKMKWVYLSTAAISATATPIPSSQRKKKNECDNTVLFLMKKTGKIGKQRWQKRGAGWRGHKNKGALRQLTTC